MADECTFNVKFIHAEVEVNVPGASTVKRLVLHALAKWSAAYVQQRGSWSNSTSKATVEAEPPADLQELAKQLRVINHDGIEVQTSLEDSVDKLCEFGILKRGSTITLGPTPQTNFFKNPLDPLLIRSLNGTLPIKAKNKRLNKMTTAEICDYLIASGRGLGTFPALGTELKSYSDSSWTKASAVSSDSLWEQDRSCKDNLPILSLALHRLMPLLFVTTSIRKGKGRPFDSTHRATKTLVMEFLAYLSDDPLFLFLKAEKGQISSAHRWMLGCIAWCDNVMPPDQSPRGRACLYVDPVQGNDAGTGLSPEYPLRTIDRAHHLLRTARLLAARSESVARVRCWQLPHGSNQDELVKGAHNGAMEVWKKLASMPLESVFVRSPVTDGAWMSYQLLCRLGAVGSDIIQHGVDSVRVRSLQPVADSVQRATDLFFRAKCVEGQGAALVRDWVEKHLLTKYRDGKTGGDVASFTAPRSIDGLIGRPFDNAGLLKHFLSMAARTSKLVLDEQGLRALCSRDLLALSELSQLSVRHNVLRMVDLCSGLQKLRILDLSHNGIGNGGTLPKGAAAFLRLQGLPMLQELLLAHNCLSGRLHEREAGGRQCDLDLTGCPNLRKIDLSHNLFDWNNADLFASAKWLCETCPRLKSIQLAGNPLTIITTSKSAERVPTRGMSRAMARAVRAFKAGTASIADCAKEYQVSNRGLDDALARRGAAGNGASVEVSKMIQVTVVQKLIELGVTGADGAAAVKVLCATGVAQLLRVRKVLVPLLQRSRSAVAKFNLQTAFARWRQDLEQQRRAALRFWWAVLRAQVQRATSAATGGKVRVLLQTSEHMLSRVAASGKIALKDLSRMLGAVLVVRERAEKGGASCLLSGPVVASATLRSRDHLVGLKLDALDGAPVELLRRHKKVTGTGGSSESKETGASVAAFAARSKHCDDDPRSTAPPLTFVRVSQLTLGSCWASLRRGNRDPALRHGGCGLSLVLSFKASSSTSEAPPAAAGGAVAYPPRPYLRPLMRLWYAVAGDYRLQALRTAAQRLVFCAKRLLVACDHVLEGQQDDPDLRAVRMHPFTQKQEHALRKLRDACARRFDVPGDSRPESGRALANHIAGELAPLLQLTMITGNDSDSDSPASVGGMAALAHTLSSKPFSYPQAEAASYLLALHVASTAAAAQCLSPTRLAAGVAAAAEMGSGPSPTRKVDALDRCLDPAQVAPSDAAGAADPFTLSAVDWQRAQWSRQMHAAIADFVCRVHRVWTRVAWRQWLAYSRQEKVQADAQQARWLQVLARHAKKRFEDLDVTLKTAVDKGVEEIRKAEVAAALRRAGMAAGGRSASAEQEGARDSAYWEDRSEALRVRVMAVDGARKLLRRQQEQGFETPIVIGTWLRRREDRALCSVVSATIRRPVAARNQYVDSVPTIGIIPDEKRQQQWIYQVEQFATDSKVEDVKPGKGAGALVYYTERELRRMLAAGHFRKV